MGIAVPGPLDVQEGIMINPPNFPGWKNVPIRSMLEERLGFGVPGQRDESGGFGGKLLWSDP